MRFRNPQFALTTCFFFGVLCLPNCLAQGVLSITPTSEGFGQIGVGCSSAPFTFTLTNASPKTRTISNIAVSSANPAFVLTQPLQTSLTNNQSTTFTATFAPATTGATGQVAITVTSTAVPNPQPIVYGIGTASQISLSLSSINYGAVLDGTTGAASEVLTNIGSSYPTCITGVQLNSPFSLATGYFPPLPLELGAGGYVDFIVDFTPTTSGTANGTLQVNGSGAQVVTATLTGVGQSYVILSWTPSTTTDVVTYNIYRITAGGTTAPATPYPFLSSITASTCSSTICQDSDLTVQPGTSYWYYAAAVDSLGNISGPSNVVQAVTP